MIPRAAITGLVLAGGQGRRMGGVDKGLVPLDGRPLAAHALARLEPQVSGCLVSANRHLDVYARFGVPVLTDTLPDHPGPLAGVLAGLAACPTDWLLTVPCDTPHFPVDLARRLAAAAVAAQADIALAATTEAGRTQLQPVFCLVRRVLHDDLARFMADGGSSPRQWAAGRDAATALFEDTAAFANANTVDDVTRLRR